MEETKKTMELTVGAILEGKIKTITNFGAFVSLPENKTGMVHISEVANAYVSDIRQHLTEGQDVKVMVIGTENGKINLSIKRLEAKPHRENTPRAANANRPAQSQQQSFRSAPTPPPAPKTADQLFEEKLKAFMSESDSKLSSIKQYSEHRTKSRRRYKLQNRPTGRFFALTITWDYFILKQEGKDFRSNPILTMEGWKNAGCASGVPAEASGCAPVSL